MTIECRADDLDMTGLLLAEQGSGSAQIEILAADVKAGSEPGVLHFRTWASRSRARAAIPCRDRDEPPCRRSGTKCRATEASRVPPPVRAAGLDCRAGLLRQ